MRELHLLDSADVVHSGGATPNGCAFTTTGTCWPTIGGSPKVRAELIFDVIGSPYERQSLLITSNLPFENLVEVMGNERLTRALLDRLTHRVHIIEANGDSLKQA